MSTLDRFETLLSLEMIHGEAHGVDMPPLDEVFMKIASDQVSESLNSDVRSMCSTMPAPPDTTVTSEHYMIISAPRVSQALLDLVASEEKT